MFNISPCKCNILAIITAPFKAKFQDFDNGRILNFEGLILYAGIAVKKKKSGLTYMFCSGIKYSKFKDLKIYHRDFPSRDEMVFKLLSLAVKFQMTLKQF